MLCSIASSKEVSKADFARSANPGYYGAKRVDARAAGNVLRNLWRWAQAEISWTVIGDDALGLKVAGMLATVANCDASLQTIDGRQTAIKTRYIASGQQMMRADRETIEDIPQECQDAIFAAVEAQLSTARALLLSDYGKGV